MGMAVISSNTSIKVDKIAYLNNLGGGAGANFVTISANANQYFEIDYFYLNVASGSCTWDIYSPDLLTSIYSSSSLTTHLFDGITNGIAGTIKKLKIPNGCQLRITTPATSTTVKISGTAFTNSP